MYGLSLLGVSGWWLTGEKRHQTQTTNSFAQILKLGISFQCNTHLQFLFQFISPLFFFSKTIKLLPIINEAHLQFYLKNINSVSSYFLIALGPLAEVSKKTNPEFVDVSVI